MWSKSWVDWPAVATWGISIKISDWPANTDSLIIVALSCFSDNHRDGYFYKTKCRRLSRHNVSMRSILIYLGSIKVSQRHIWPLSVMVPLKLIIIIMEPYCLRHRRSRWLLHSPKLSPVRLTNTNIRYLRKSIRYSYNNNIYQVSKIRKCKNIKIEIEVKR